MLGLVYRMLEVNCVDEKNEMTAKSYAKRKNKSPSWGRWVAQQCKKKNIKTGIRKDGGQWRGTFEQWESAYKALNVRSRKR